MKKLIGTVISKEQEAKFPWAELVHSGWKLEMEEKGEEDEVHIQVTLSSGQSEARRREARDLAGNAFDEVYWVEE